jgi:hypothetical protein
VFGTIRAARRSLKASLGIMCFGIFELVSKNPSSHLALCW